MTDKLTINHAKCTNCGLCVEVCFFGNFQPGDGGVTASPGAPCVECGHCVAVCPTEAISHSGLGTEPLPEARPPSYDQLLALMKMRRSRREFTDQPVERELIDKLLAAAVQAPNAINQQHVHYTVVTDRDTLKQLTRRAMASIGQMRKLLSKWSMSGFMFRTFNRYVYEGLRELQIEIDGLTDIPEDRDLVLYDAPCLIVVHTPKSDICGPEDAVYCAANILLAAETLGLGACVIGFITGPANYDRSMKRLLEIRGDHTVQTSIIVGHPKLKYARPAPKNPANTHFLT